MTDCIDATVCAHCGRSALFDGVELISDENVIGRKVWHCVKLPCASNSSEKPNVKRKRKKEVRIHQLWTDPLLERLSSRLSPGTSQIGLVGDPSKLSCPKHYSYDIMIPLVHASVEEPLGWVLFGAKYLDNGNMRQVLRGYVTRKLRVGDHKAALADLIVLCYCTGRPITARKLRRTLDLGRGSDRPYHQANERLLNNLHAIENNYSRLVRKYL